MSGRYLLTNIFRQCSTLNKKKANNIIINYVSVLKLTHNFQFYRLKYSKSSTYQIQSDDENDEIFNQEKDSKIMKVKVNSLRGDLILRAGLGIARNKIETYFYESKVRLNGKKFSKKSVKLKINDEIDIIKGFSQRNPNHLLIFRVHILYSKKENDDVFIMLRIYNNLIIENYYGSDAFKSADV